MVHKDHQHEGKSLGTTVIKHPITGTFENLSPMSPAQQTVANVGFTRMASTSFAETWYKTPNNYTSIARNKCLRRFTGPAKLLFSVILRETCPFAHSLLQMEGESNCQKTFRCHGYTDLLRWVRLSLAFQALGQTVQRWTALATKHNSVLRQ